MNCTLNKGDHVGTGGNPVPFDTTPQPPPSKPRTDKPWASTAKSGTFGTHLYEPIGSPVKLSQAGSNKPHFHAGKVPEKFSSYKHMIDSHVSEKQKKPFRLLCGKANGLFDPHVHKGERMVLPPQEKPKSKPSFAPPIVTRRNVENTFGKYPEHMPHSTEDYDPRRNLKRNLKPIYTWSTKTKRSMPIRYVACLSIWAITFLFITVN